ncbi:MAG: TIGR00180 family glycosyltransferase [Pseudomonadota bacterium]
MTRVLIPTRNRPSSLLSVVRFLERFYPETRVIVADGSLEDFAKANKAAMESADRSLDIEYRRYPYDMPFFDRLLDVLNGLDDRNIIMGSDDDFPLMDALARAEAELDACPPAVTSMGAILAFSMWKPDDLHASLTVSRAIEGPNARWRCAMYGQWPFSSTYAVTRREHLIERYVRAREIFLTGFFDFGVGLHDAAAGGIAGVPEITFIATRNYNHSYLRPLGSLHFLRRSDDVMRLVNYCVEDLMAFDGMDRAEAEGHARTLFHRKITGIQIGSRSAFETTPYAMDPIIIAQRKSYEAILRVGTAERDKYVDRLTHVIRAMQDAAVSSDNRTDAARVESLDEQMRDGQRLAPEEAAITKEPANLTNPTSFLKHVDTEKVAWKSDWGERVHVLALGQSNLANHGAGPLRAAKGAALVKGETVPLADPVPGGSGTGASVWPIVAEKMAASPNVGELLLSLRAQGGTSIADWAPGGFCYEALEKELIEIADGPQPPTYIVWHQGEADNRKGTSAQEYEDRFAELHNLVSMHIPTGLWIVCRASLRMGSAAPEVIAAQEAIIERYDNVIAGPNTDVLTGPFRSDGTHFSEAGILAFADLLHDVIRNRIALTVQAGVLYKNILDLRVRQRAQRLKMEAQQRAQLKDAQKA